MVPLGIDWTMDLLEPPTTYHTLRRTAGSQLKTPTRVPQGVYIGDVVFFNWVGVGGIRYVIVPTKAGRSIIPKVVDIIVVIPEGQMTREVMEGPGGTGSRFLLHLYTIQPLRTLGSQRHRVSTYWGYGHGG